MPVESDAKSMLESAVKELRDILYRPFAPHSPHCGLFFARGALSRPHNGLSKRAMVSKKVRIER